MVSQDWRADAACRDEDPELFMPVSYKGAGAKAAEMGKAICHRCPVAAECLAAALKERDRTAVRGGLTPEERRGMGTPPPPPERVALMHGRRQRPHISADLRVRVRDLVDDGVPVADVVHLAGIGEHWVRMIKQEAAA
ncbi:WhiB family transcriptional regulator [Saccharopolyspora sp. 6V]|uniref:WhiB family transcriptional regulator n=1 Tax=Saccharopolyspora sp. 6V TaxID=2877239 RepID=UPI0027E1C53D|nr:WhiB family transcriptional regulator [Saccharopolyspora sp. 6V]